MARFVGFAFDRWASRVVLRTSQGTGHTSARFGTHQQTDWEIQLALNCTTNRVTNSNPLELLIVSTTRSYDLLLPDNVGEREIVFFDVRQQAIRKI